MRQVITWLVDRDYAAVEARSAGIRLSADMIKQAIDEYGRKLVLPPDVAFLELDAIRVGYPERPTWSIRFDLWTEVGQSELSLECTVIEQPAGGLALEMDDIDVL